MILSSGSAGAGNGNIQYVVSANPDLTPRTGRIRVNPPVYVPAVDLTKQLWTYIPGEGNTNDQSGWNRHLSGTIDDFDGTYSQTLSGNSFLRGGDHSMTFSIHFRLDTIDSINRLLQIERSSADYTAIYVNAENKLVLHIGSQSYPTDFTVQAGTWYQLVLAADHNHQVNLYAAAVGSEEISVIGSHALASAPFPHDYLTDPDQFVFGYSSLPNTGYLGNGGMKDIRIYRRTLNEEEIAALHLSSITNLPFGTAQVSGAPYPVLKMNLRGQAIAISSDGATYSPAALSLGSNSRVTTAWEVVGTSYQGNSLIPDITGTFRTGSTSTLMDWRYQFTYVDGTQGFTGQHTARSSTTFTDNNPHPTRPVASVSLLASMSNYMGGPYGFSVIGSQIHALPRFSGSTWTAGDDRFSLAQRALVGNGSGIIVLDYHTAYFSEESATYNFGSA